MKPNKLTRKLLMVGSFFLLFSNGVYPNTGTSSGAIITELYFDENDDWTIELRFGDHLAQDTLFYMVTSTDTFSIVLQPDSILYRLITQEDFETGNAYIDPDGDQIQFYYYMHNDYWTDLTGAFIFGDHLESNVNAPQTGQSLITLIPTGGIVIDTAHSLGFYRDPAKGHMQGMVYDSLMNPIPYFPIQTYGMEAKTLWSDENGLIHDSNLYARNYRIFVYKDNPIILYRSDFSIEPMNTTQHNVNLDLYKTMNFSGICFLSGEEDYSQTNIIMMNECPYAENDTVVTDSAGFFAKEIGVGHYKWRYSHEGYLPYYVSYREPMFFDTIFPEQTLEEGIVNEIPGGKVSGHWTAEYPYWIFGNLEIQANDSLIIDPGVNIRFTWAYDINVYGTLLAEGTKEDTILMNGNPEYGYWNSLSFYDTTSSGSRLSYIKPMRVKKGIIISNSSPLIEHVYFQMYAGGIHTYGTSHPVIRNNYFYYDGISCNDFSSPIVTNNVFYEGDVGSYQYSQPLIKYNDFYGAFVCIGSEDNSMPLVIGNIFDEGGYGLDDNGNVGFAEVKYNVFNTNNAPSWGDIKLPDFGIINTVNINNDSCDKYFNLFQDPMLVDPENGNFYPKPGSPCINAGDPDDKDPDSTIADIGAFFYNLFTEIPEFYNKPEEIRISHYPNPANERLIFKVELFGLTKHKSARILIWSVSGKLLAEIPCYNLNSGERSFYYPFNTKQHSLENGTYVYALESNLFYPFPKDSTYVLVSDVFAFEMNDSAKNVLVSHNQRLAALKLTIPPNAEKKLNIGYTQEISGNHTEYIVTTTRKWNKPIELAQFELIIPDHIVIDSLKYIPHDTSFINNKVHYYFSEEAFFPEEEFEVYFHYK